MIERNAYHSRQELCPVCNSIQIVLGETANGVCIVCTHKNVYVLGQPNVGDIVPVIPPNSKDEEAYIVCHIRAKQKFRGKTHVCVSRIGPLNPASADYMRDIST